MRGRLYRSIGVLLGLGLIFTSGTESAIGASFPRKPIKIIVNYPAGSAIDTEARGIAPYLEKYLGVRIIIEDAPGADGKIGLIKTWKAAPDGYTLAVHTSTMSAIVESLTGPEYRLTDFSQIYTLSRSNSILVVNSDKWKTFDEFVKAAQKDTLSAGLPGIGSTAHLNGLILMDRLGIKVNWVPFGSSAGNLTALAGKHVDFIVAGSNIDIRSLVNAGKVRPLLVMSGSRDIVFPNVPLAKELGHKIDFIGTIRGADGPPNLPPEIRKVIEDAFAKAVKEPEYLSWAEKRSIEVFPLNHTAYKGLITNYKKDIDKYKGAFNTAK